MELYILRHGLAGERIASSREKDGERRLTKEGVRKMREVAKGMKTAGMSFGVILTSPYPRAKETAELVAKTFGMGHRLEVSEALVPEGNPRELVEAVNRHRRAKKGVLLVGHEPYLSRLISVLIAGKTGVAMDLRKGGLCRLTTARLKLGQCATLDWLVTPRQIRKGAKI